MYFDHTEVGGRSVEVVVIENDGQADLRILGLSRPDAPFDMGPVGSVLVPPGQVVEFEVEFNPTTAGSFSSKVQIESDDPVNPVVEVGLQGVGVGPLLEVTPDEVDFGVLYVGCDEVRQILVKNAGSASLSVTGFDYGANSEELSFDAFEDVNGPLPWDLVPGSELEVWVDYAPLDEGQDLATLTVESTDPTGAVTAIHLGEGRLYGEQLDVFQQATSGQVDILFAVDQSCSMYEHNQSLSANFGTLMATLADTDADYHVGAVYRDDGCVVADQPYIDNTMSLVDQQTAFDTMICTAGNCGYGSNTERGFMLLEAALSADNAAVGGCNEGFYREDAALALVGVSDEPEQSVNPYSYYVSLFQSLKASSDDVVIHAIGGDYPQGCEHADGFSAMAYTGMYEATIATGGLFLSICATDFGDHLGAFADVASNADMFELSEYPVEDTLVVTVNGVQQQQGWSWNAVDNTVEFDEQYVPEGGSTIEVRYALQGPCD